MYTSKKFSELNSELFTPRQTEIKLSKGKEKNPDIINIERTHY